LLQSAWLQGVWLQSAWLQGVWLQSAWLQSVWLESAWLQSANIKRFSNLTLNLDEGFSTAVYRLIEPEVSQER
jgi:hypothetical protein